MLVFECVTLENRSNRENTQSVMLVTMQNFLKWAKAVRDIAIDKTEMHHSCMDSGASVLFNAFNE